MKKGKKNSVLDMAYASSLGIAMVIAVFGSLLIGSYLDRKLGTRSIFTILFLVIGVAAGFRNYYLFFKKHLKDEPTNSGTGIVHKLNANAKDTPPKKD